MIIDIIICLVLFILTIPFSAAVQLIENKVENKNKNNSFVDEMKYFLNDDCGIFIMIFWPMCYLFGTIILIIDIIKLFRRKHNLKKY